MYKQLFLFEVWLEFCLRSNKFSVISRGGHIFLVINQRLEPGHNKVEEGIDFKTSRPGLM